MPARPTNETSNYIAFGKQTDKDTEATTFYFLRHLDGSGFDSDPDIQTVREGGGGQGISFNYKRQLKSAGQMVAYSRPEIAGRIEAAALGNDSASLVAATNNGLVCHTAVPAATIPSLTVEQRAADMRERIANAKVSQVDWEYQAGEPVKITVAFTGGGTYTTPDVASALTATREAVADRHHFLGASIVLDGAANTKVTKLKVTMKRGLDDGIQTNALTIDDLPELTQDYDIDYTLKYEDRTLYQKVRAGAGGSVVQTALPTGALDIYVPGYQTASYGHRLVVPLMEYTGAKVNRLDPDGKTVYLDVSAMAVPGGTHLMFAQNWTSGQGAATAAF